MPAYFEVCFQYEKGEASKSVVERFCTALIQCGASFKCGFFEAEQDSLSDIIRWNQKKLDENFELGFAEHVSHDYKQILFNFCSFSEVRLFIQNLKESTSVFFYLIIPESDLANLEETDGYYRMIKLHDKMNLIESLAIRMWEIGDLNSIQTGWEGSDFPALFDEIVQGKTPNVEPFCIVSRDIVRNEWNCTTQVIGHNGMLLKNDENWFPF